MHSDLKIEFATLLRYSSKPTTQNGLKSKKICGALKNGTVAISNRACELIKTDYLDFFSEFFNDDTIVIPMPRSSPLTNEALWPAKIICNEFYRHNLCKDVLEILIRNKRVPQSSLQSRAPDRPDIQTHYNSFLVKPSFIPYRNIVIIDDVLTLGRTSTAAYMRIKENYPDHSVKVFSVMRTRSKTDDNILIDAQTGVMNFKVKSGNVQMPD
jgi:hypothetical protein